MKKILGKLLLCVLALVMVMCVVACNNGESIGSVDLTLTNWGAVKSQGGFIVETDNYVYFINGIGSFTESNEYGKPVKGALCVADKNDLSKCEIVVPKLLVASDYTAGIYIYGSGAETYVYYGTPNENKDSSGNIANSEMRFMKTRLDGKESKVFDLTLSSLSSEYRFVENAGVVYIVYYNENDLSLNSFNTQTGENSVIAKQDEKLDESLNAYKFVDNGSLNDAVVLYTTTVYSADYNEEKASTDTSYSRPTESFNNVYAYKAGANKAEQVISGKEDILTYEFKLIENGYVFLTQKDLSSNEKVIAYAVNDFATAKEIKNSAYLSEETFIVNSLEEFYVCDCNSNKLACTTLIANEATVKKYIADCSEISKLLLTEGDYIYFLNADSELNRLLLSGEGEVEKLSESSIATDWYAPKAIAGKLFYCDNSAYGSSYIKYVSLSNIEDTGLVGKLASGDITKFVMTYVDVVEITSSGEIELEENDEGKLVSASYEKAQKAYDELSDSDKSLLDSGYVARLDDFKQAIKFANMLKDLDGMRNYDSGDTEKVALLKTAFEQVKTEKAKLSSDKQAKVWDLIGNNYKWNFQKAEEIFAD